MKINKSFFVSLALCTLLCGCTDNNSEPDFTIPTNTEITNPFKDNNDEITVDGEIIENYGVGVNVSYDDFEYLTYDDDRLTLPLIIQNEGSDLNWGVMIFVDGILQEYSSNENSEKSTMQTFQVNEKSTYSCELYADNIIAEDSKDETVLAFLNVANPQIQPSEGAFSGHNGSAGLPIPLRMDSAAKNAEVKIETDYESHLITEGEEERFFINKNYNTFNLVLDEADSEEQPLNILAPDSDGKLQLKLYSYALNQTETDYMVSIYKNHERIRFNGDSDYIKICSRNGYMNVADIELENVQEGDFIYCIAAPIDSYDVAVQKYPTIPIVSREKLPERTKSEWFILDPDSINTEEYEEMYEDDELIEDYSPEDFVTDNTDDDILAAIADNEDAQTGYVALN